ncbi:MAG: phosphoribosyltransferase [Gammaproteobacteria bacterium]|nr:phosphoribosyltransferase [Gammaproteobacteria bacterium]
MFQNRKAAALALAKALHAYQSKSPLVLGIPRGGIVIAKILSDQLKGDLDVILIRKIGAPGNPEFAIGAVTESGRFWAAEHLQKFRIPARYVKDEVQKELAIICQRRLAYTPIRPSLPIEERTVIIVDDGIATGSTMKAALEELRTHHPQKIIVAIPVAPSDSLISIRVLADEVVCLLEPIDFYAVGQFYQDFPQVSDKEVIALLK